MIAINDNIADGRDVSWLWDVNFLPLSGQEACITSGRRAADIALRLSYDDIKTKNIEPKLPIALKMLSEQTGEKVILATYTAMLPLYDMLSSQGNRVE
jgi:UDP-N-acetylmuramyl tripeptide synthase